MLGDIYEPALWNGFFTMVGGGVAALTGLVFVALSLSLDEMTAEATHKYRSINTLAGLTSIFVGCGLVLMGGQDHVAVGVELAAVSVIGALVFLNGFRQAFRLGSQPSSSRLILGGCLYAAQLIGGMVLASGSIAGLYVSAAATVLNVAFMISAAWLLVVGLYRSRTPASKA